MLPVLHFDCFEVDLRTEEVRKEQRRIRLPRQSFRILKRLLQRPGEIVAREELAQDLWPAHTFVDFDHGLNAAVNRLRKALNDSAAVPIYIETLPRRGYRFIGSLRTNGLPEETTYENDTTIKVVKDAVKSRRTLLGRFLRQFLPHMRGL